MSVVTVVENFAPAQVESLLEVGLRFRDWERQEVLLGDPSPETIARHRKSLSTLIRLTRCWLSMVSDPEAFDAKTYSRLTMLHRRLSDSWDMFHNKPTATEAAQLAALAGAHFPE